MFNYDAEKRIASITVAPLEFDVDDLVASIQLALDKTLENHYYFWVDDINPDDYRELCNLVFEKAKYKENKA